MSAADQFVHRTVSQHARTLWHQPNGDGGAESPPIEVHATVVASNDPVEDRYAVAALGNALVVGVHDGHAGWQCADLMARVFHNYVGRHFISASASGKGGEQALEAAYDEFDADLLALASQVHALAGVSDTQRQALLMPAMAGAVSVSAIVDGDRVYVGHAGDCRAVIGRRSSTTGTGAGWTTVELTRDHDANNPAEVKRLRSEHPGEEVVVRGRVLGGLMPFRSLGDARYKWSHAVQEWIGQVFEESEYPYKHPPRNFKSPPYVTGHPETVSYALDDKDAFMVLATDGLWEKMSSESVVDMVAEYITSQEKGTWAHVERNAAAHVVRNAFGGRDAELVASTLKIPSPLSRRYRDDITVVVVFFRPGRSGGPEMAPVDAERPEPIDLGQSKIVATDQGLRTDGTTNVGGKAKL
ncbi:phosphatase 2C-like domain-containing protein [Blastocladiella britannica]|nr:phosphatase 2C-like domain-containing protein [Blastocladiella britannica]